MLHDYLPSLARNGRESGPSKKVLGKARLYSVSTLVDFEMLNVSEHGIAGRAWAEFEPGQRVHFSFDNCSCHEGEIRWVRGDRFGARLRGAKLITDELHLQPDFGVKVEHRTRPRRIAHHMEGKVALSSSSVAASILDISADGVMLDTLESLHVAGAAVLHMAHVPTMLGRIRWLRPGIIGFRANSSFFPGD